MTPMFLDIGMPELVAILVIAAIFLSPEKIAPAARKAAKIVRFLRGIANNATDQIKAELGPEIGDLAPGIELADLNPASLVSTALDGEISELRGVGGELLTLREEMSAMRTEVTKLRLQAGAPLIPPRVRQTPMPTTSPVELPSDGLN
jgi:sec-independent protein translocase protein TatB